MAFTIYYHDNIVTKINMHSDSLMMTQVKWVRWMWTNSSSPCIQWLLLKYRHNIRSIFGNTNIVIILQNIDITFGSSSHQLLPSSNHHLIYLTHLPLHLKPRDQRSFPPHTRCRVNQKKSQTPIPTVSSIVIRKIITRRRSNYMSTRKKRTVRNSSELIKKL